MQLTLLRTVMAATLFVTTLSAAGSRTIETIAGNGAPGFSATQVHDVLGLTMGPDGALYFSDAGNHVIRRLDVKTRALTTVAGNGQKGNEGAGGLATDATLNQPYEIIFDPAGNLYIADTPSHVVLKVDAKTRKLTTLAGTAGKTGFSGDGGPAATALFNAPSGLAITRDGALLICDGRNNRIRRVDLKSGTIDTFAGTGETKPTPADAPVQGTPLTSPRTVTVAANGDIYVALRTAIHKIDPQAQRITHVAGLGGQPGPAGDGPGEVLPPAHGDARKATLASPKAIALSPDGGLYLSDTETHRILRIDLKTHAIETVAGTGERGDNGVGHNAGTATSPDGPAMTRKLSRPHGLVIDKAGALYFSDSFSNRIRVLR